jgi:hypothetical protein
MKYIKCLIIILLAISCEEILRGHFTLNSTPLYKHLFYSDELKAELRVIDQASKIIERESEIYKREYGREMSAEMISKRYDSLLPHLRALRSPANE